MKTAILSTFYPFRGGIAQFSACLYRAFEKRCEVSAYTFTRQYPGVLFPGKTQYVTDEDNADPIPSIESLDTIDPISWRRTAKRIAAEKPDLLLLNYFMPFFAPSTGYVAGALQKSGTKVISIVHNIIPHEKRLGDSALIKYFVKRNDGFVTLSKSVADDLLAFDPQAKYILKPHPIYDHFGEKMNAQAARKKLGLDANASTILFFGFIREYKGLDVLIRAMRHLPENRHLVIAGEMYGDFEKYASLIAELGLESRVKTFIKYIPDDEAKLFFSAADVGVLPYKSATQSGIAQVAMHFDLPLIVTNVGGLSELVEDGKTGMVVEAPEEKQLADALRRYFDDELKIPYSAAIAEQKHAFSWDGFADAVLKLYQKL